MLVRCSEAVELEVLKVIGDFAIERQTEIHDYMARYSNSHELQYVAHITDTNVSGNPTYTVSGGNNSFRVYEYGSPYTTVRIAKLVSMHNDHYDHLQITWVMYEIELYAD